MNASLGEPLSAGSKPSAMSSPNFRPIASENKPVTDEQPLQVLTSLMSFESVNVVGDNLEGLLDESRAAAAEDSVSGPGERERVSFVDALYARLEAFGSPEDGSIHKSDLAAVLGLVDDSGHDLATVSPYLTERLFKVFAGPADQKGAEAASERISKERFLSVITEHFASREKKAQFLFSLCDHDADGLVSTEEIVKLLGGGSSVLLKSINAQSRRSLNSSSVRKDDDALSMDTLDRSGLMATSKKTGMSYQDFYRHVSSRPERLGSARSHDSHSNLMNKTVMDQSRASMVFAHHMSRHAVRMHDEDEDEEVLVEQEPKSPISVPSPAAAAQTTSAPEKPVSIKSRLACCVGGAPLPPNHPPVTDPFVKPSVMVRLAHDRVEAVWLFLYFATNLIVFLYYFFQVFDNKKAKPVVSLAGPFARASAQCVNWNVLITILAICRSLLTWMRANVWWHIYLPIDSAVAIHKMAGTAVFLFALMHIGAWIAGFDFFGKATLEEQNAFLNPRHNLSTPMTTRDLWLGTIPGGTGIVLMILMVIAYPFTLRVVRGSKGFVVFWITHFFFIPFVVVLCFHGAQQLVAPFSTIYWVMVPLFFYILDLSYRVAGLASKANLSRVVSAKVLCDGKVLHLELEKPKGTGIGKAFANSSKWDTFLPGAYLFCCTNDMPNVKCGVGVLEWHPFTISSAPEDEYLSLHIAPAGDWTTDLMHSAANLKTMHLDGPFGAPTQNYLAFDSVMFIAAGIGATPMASILRSMRNKFVELECDECGHHIKAFPPSSFHCKRVVLIWVAKNEKQFEWLSELLKEVCEVCHPLIEVFMFTTSGKPKDLTLEEDGGAQTKLPPGLHQQIGRPDWANVIKSAELSSKQITNSCGVFFTGGNAMGDEILKACLSSNAANEKKKDSFRFTFEREVF